MKRSLIITLMASFTAMFMIATTASAQDVNDRFNKFQEEVMPLLKELSRRNDQEYKEALANAARLVNTSPTEKIVVSLGGNFVSTQIREGIERRHARAGILGLCGRGQTACPNVAIYLRQMTAPCKNVFLATLDLDRYPAVPADLYRAKDNRLIIFLQTEPGSMPFRVEPRGEPTLKRVAMAVCPGDATALGSIIEMHIPN